jgi:hypothetical protein
MNGGAALAFNNNGTSKTVSFSGSGIVPIILRNEYDFAVDGGVTGTISLRNGSLPSGARVTRAWYQVVKTFTSATDSTTIGISIPTDDVNGILAPIAINDAANPWDQGLHMTIQSGLVGAFSEKTKAARTLQLTVTGEAITAGKMILYSEFFVDP